MAMLHFTGNAVKPVPSEFGEKVLAKDVITSKECGTMSAGLDEIKPGVSIDWTYVYDEVLLILDGEIQLTSGKQKIVARGGDVVYIPTGEEVNIATPTKTAKIFWVTHPNWLEAVDAAKRFKG